jgi:hypothetical protein
MDKDSSKESLAYCQKTPLSQMIATPKTQPASGCLHACLRPGLSRLAFYEMPPGDNESKIPLHMGPVNTDYRKY